MMKAAKISVGVLATALMMSGLTVAVAHAQSRSDIQSPAQASPGAGTSSGEAASQPSARPATTPAQTDSGDPIATPLGTTTDQTAGAMPAGQPDAGGQGTNNSASGATAAPVDGAAATGAAVDPAGAEIGLDQALLPHDLSPWGMFMNADFVVKLVMLGLAFASVVTWTVFLAKATELMLMRRRTLSAFAVLAEARSLATANEQLNGARGPGVALLHAVQAELRLASDACHEGLKERVASRLERVEAGTTRMMTRGTGVLATIGSTAPFVGLFGTVWGIMNSFIGISKAQTTNLAVVAPGIAEALLATAIGLVAAIPAVVIYNLFARFIAANKAAVSDTAAAVLRLVSRELDRNAVSYAKAAA